MNLAELNDRWRATGKPHATPEGDFWVWHCPHCGQGGRTRLPLYAAMSDSLAHKKHCAP